VRQVLRDINRMRHRRPVFHPRRVVSGTTIW
jgi:hypothetical protein